MPPESVPSNSNSLRATYDPGAKALYIILPGHPDTPGCVEKTLEDENGVLHDMVGGRVIGLEVLLAQPLEILSGESGETRTGNVLETLLHASSVPESDAPSATPRSPFGV